MSIIAWKEEYSVGIDKIDKQHKHLIDLLNTLHDAMLQGKGKEKMESVLDELVDYTEYHFRTEEEIFEKHSFSNSVNHKKEHDKFKEKVVDFRNKLKADKAVISGEILKLIKEWINNHILEDDKKYVSELSGKE